MRFYDGQHKFYCGVDLNSLVLECVNSFTCLLDPTRASISARASTRLRTFIQPTPNIMRHHSIRQLSNPRLC